MWASCTNRPQHSQFLLIMIQQFLHRGQCLIYIISVKLIYSCAQYLFDNIEMNVSLEMGSRPVHLAVYSPHTRSWLNTTNTNTTTTTHNFLAVFSSSPLFCFLYKPFSSESASFSQPSPLLTLASLLLILLGHLQQPSRRLRLLPPAVNPVHKILLLMVTFDRMNDVKE